MSRNLGPVEGRRRALGQHFLRDLRTAEAIAHAGILAATESGARTLLEIGPGKGALTRFLLKKKDLFQRFLVCERDSKLVTHWQQEAPSLEMIEADFLDVPIAQWDALPPVAVVSNLPYSAGTAIFTRLAGVPAKVSAMTLMFQSEVAQRLRAECGTKSWGSLSVWTQNQWSITKFLSVPPGAFSPPPEVQSEVVICKPLPAPRVPGTDTEKGSRLWNELLRACFAHRRKMLRSCLSGKWKDILLRSSVDPTRRAESLSWNDWTELFKNAALLLCLLCYFGSPALANIGDTYGYGSRSAALAGAVAGSQTGGFSSFSNPASVSAAATARPQSRLALSWTTLLMQPSFDPVDNVVLTNDYTAGQTKVGSVDFSDHKATFGQAMGFAYEFTDWKKLSLGLAAFLPVEHYARVDTGEVYAPQYPMFLNRTQRPQIEAALSAEVIPSLYFGAGVHLTLSLTSTVDLLMETNTNKPSSMRMVSSVAPQAVPTLGLQWITPSLSLGTVFRFASAAPNKVTMNSTFKPGFAPGGVDFRATGNSTLYYDPATLELGAAWKTSPATTLYAQLDYQKWMDYSPSMIQIEGLPDGATIQPSKNPSFLFRNILVPKMGQEIEIGTSTLRWGYAYRPGILADPPTEAGNLLDPPRHEWNTGLGFKFRHFLHLETPCELDFHFSYHALSTQHVSKSPGNEVGNAAESKVGAPGYDAGGKIYGGGVSLSLTL